MISKQVPCQIRSSDLRVPRMNAPRWRNGKGGTFLPCGNILSYRNGFVRTGLPAGYALASPRPCPVVSRYARFPASMAAPTPSISRSTAFSAAALLRRSACAPSSTFSRSWFLTSAPVRGVSRMAAESPAPNPEKKHAKSRSVLIMHFTSKPSANHARQNDVVLKRHELA
jgi:hypothetical protein